MTSTPYRSVHILSRISFLPNFLLKRDHLAAPLCASMEPTEKRKLDAVTNGDEPSAKKRVIGPSLPPPQPADAHDDSNKDSRSDSDGDSDSDDDFGPGLPPSLGGAQPAPQTSVHSAPEISEAQKKESQRDQWMLQPPSQSDWASKIDPTQLRNRKFQTGKSARAPSSKQVDATWVETPEERMRRLQDEVMGVGVAPNRTEQRSSGTKDAARARAMEEKIKKFNVGLAMRRVPVMSLRTIL